MAFANVAIVGSTGLVGLELISILEKRPYDIGELKLYASEKSRGKEKIFRGRTIRIEPAEIAEFRGVDVAFFMAGAGTSRKFVPLARSAGALTVDNSSAFRRDPDVPLVVPEVNPHSVTAHEGLISNPNCTVIQLAVAIHPIHLLSPIRRLIVSTYQSISGAGRSDWERLVEETRSCIEGKPSGIAFNLWPGIDRLLEDGYYFEEDKVMEETRKIFGDDNLAISATTVRVPVFRSHSIAVYLETEDPVDLSDVKRSLDKAPGVELVGRESDLQSLSPADIAGQDGVRVGRLRKDRWSDRGLLMWVVADNLRKGAALNAVQIAELVLGKG
jgi:aspartate-semialdehyde dehydrogenase